MLLALCACLAPPSNNNIRLSSFHGFSSISVIPSRLLQSLVPPSLVNSHLGLRGLSFVLFTFPSEFPPWLPRSHLITGKRRCLKLPLSPLDLQRWGGVYIDDIYSSASCNLIPGVPGSSPSSSSSVGPWALSSSPVSRPSPPCRIQPPPVSPPPCFPPPTSQARLPSP